MYLCNLAQLCQSLVFFYLKICYSPVTANKHIDNIKWYFGKQNFSSSRCHMFLGIFFWYPTRIVGSSRILFSCQFIQLNSFGAIYPYNLIRIWKDSKFFCWPANLDFSAVHILLKFIYSEKVIKFCEISTLYFCPM